MAAAPAHSEVSHSATPSLRSIVPDGSCGDSSDRGPEGIQPNASEPIFAPGEQSQIAKWREMLNDWDNYVAKYPQQVRQSVREGIPDQLRGEVWKACTGSSNLQDRFSSGVYQKLVKCPCPFEDKIQMDVFRTFPEHPVFAEKGGAGQQRLANVVRSYSLWDPSVGYCQGMAFVAGLFLLHLESEEAAFWVMVQVMNHYSLREMFQPGLPRLNSYLNIFEQLLEDFCPTLYTHLSHHGVCASMYASQWFITLFVYQFPLAMVSRVWDIFLLEGMPEMVGSGRHVAVYEIVFRVALALMTHSQDELIRLDFEAIIMHLKALPDSINDQDQADRIIMTALNLDISEEQRSHFERLRPRLTNSAHAHNAPSQFDRVEEPSSPLPMLHQPTAALAAGGLLQSFRRNFVTVATSMTPRSVSFVENLIANLQEKLSDPAHAPAQEDGGGSQQGNAGSLDSAGSGTGKPASHPQVGNGEPAVLKDNGSPGSVEGSLPAAKHPPYLVPPLDLKRASQQ